MINTEKDRQGRRSKWIEQEGATCQMLSSLVGLLVICWLLSHLVGKIVVYQLVIVVFSQGDTPSWDKCNCVKWLQEVDLEGGGCDSFMFH